MSFATEENVRRGLSLARSERQAATEAEPFNQNTDHAWLAVCPAQHMPLKNWKRDCSTVGNRSDADETGE